MHEVRTKDKFPYKEKLFKAKEQYITKPKLVMIELELANVGLTEC